MSSVLRCLKCLETMTAPELERYTYTSRGLDDDIGCPNCGPHATFRVVSTPWDED